MGAYENPAMITDQSGQLLAQGISQFGQGVAKGIDAYGQKIEAQRAEAAALGKKRQEARDKSFAEANKNWQEIKDGIVESNGSNATVAFGENFNDFIKENKEQYLQAYVMLQTGDADQQKFGADMISKMKDSIKAKTGYMANIGVVVDGINDSTINKEYLSSKDKFFWQSSSQPFGNGFEGITYDYFSKNEMDFMQMKIKLTSDGKGGYEIPKDEFGKDLFKPEDIKDGVVTNDVNLQNLNTSSVYGVPVKLSDYGDVGIFTGVVNGKTNEINTSAQVTSYNPDGLGESITYYDSKATSIALRADIKADVKSWYANGKTNPRTYPAVLATLMSPPINMSREKAEGLAKDSSEESQQKMIDHIYNIVAIPSIFSGASISIASKTNVDEIIEANKKLPLEEQIPVPKPGDEIIYSYTEADAPEPETPTTPNKPTESQRKDELDRQYIKDGMDDKKSTMLVKNPRGKFEIVRTQMDDGEFGWQIFYPAGTRADGLTYSEQTPIDEGEKYYKTHAEIVQRLGYVKRLP